MSAPMNFAKTFWAALLAFVVANIVMVVITFLFFAMFVAAVMMSLGLRGQGAAEVPSNSVLKIDLAGAIVDAPPVSPFEAIDFQTLSRRNILTIYQAVGAIDHAASDPHIRGIYLEPGNGAVNLANLEEIRNAVLRFRESGKFVVGYADYYTQRTYYLCSSADRLYMNPQGAMMWQGMSSDVMFYKGLLDKLGVQVEVFRHGSFKAAVEPFIADRMSPENRLQMNTLVGSIWNGVVDEIGASRDVKPALLQQYASNLSVDSAEAAVSRGMIDSLIYRDQVMSILGGLVYGEGSEDEPNLVSLGEYIPSLRTKPSFTKNRIALIYADGTIVDGEGMGEGQVGGAALAEKIARMRDDQTVKGVVLRINSPGGSALAAEVIWREMERLRAEKPLVVSMGGTAASGGYYIAAPADIILANKATVTGSIGVFGLMLNLEKGLRDKLGVTVETARTNPSADFGSPFRSVSARESEFILGHIDRTYTTFVQHVADGRNMTFEAVDKIAEGRVWAASDALAIGLIDGFGGLRDAISLAADRAGIADTYSVYQVGDKEPNIFSIFASYTEARYRERMRSELGDLFTHYAHVQSVISQQGVQARMPFTLEID